MSTAGVGNHSVEGTSAPWVWAAVLGVVELLIGIAFLFNLGAAVQTIVVLVGVGLIVMGAGTLLLASSRTLGLWLSGGVLIAAGFAAFAWPNMTLWALALVAGASLMMSGALRIAMSVVARDEVRNWGWNLAHGIVTLGAGLVALAWPSATVAVLGLVLAIRLTVGGLIDLRAAKMLHDLQP